LDPDRAVTVWLPGSNDVACSAPVKFPVESVVVDEVDRPFA
jgi:hypothetical protein